MQKRCSRPSSLGQPSSPRSQFGEWLSLLLSFIKMIFFTNPSVFTHFHSLLLFLNHFDYCTIAGSLRIKLRIF